MPAVSESLGQSTARGFAWMASVSVLAKVLTTANQIFLGWMLTAQDFGLVGLAVGLTAIPSVLQSAGVGTILVQRQRKLRAWSSTAFWMSAAAGTGAAAIVQIAAIALVWTRVWDVPLLPLIVIPPVISTFLSGLATLPIVRLQTELRFRTLATLSICGTIGQVVPSAVLAWMGAGVFAILLPACFWMLASTVLVWRIAPVRVRPRLHISRWGVLASLGWRVVATNLIWALTGQWDRFVLGATVRGDPERAVGTYFFAANLSTQTSSLIVMNLAQVLFPAMSRLSHDPERQVAAYLRAARLLAIVGVPLALLQAALAAPVLRILFWEKWTDAVPVLQLLSVATAAYVVSGSVTSLIMGQGRYGANFKMALAFVVCTLTAVSVGAILGGTVGAAGAVAGLQVVFSYVGFRVGLAGSGRGTRAVLRVYALPVLASVASIGPAWALGSFAADRLAASGPFVDWSARAAGSLSGIVRDPPRLAAIVAAAPLWLAAWAQAGVTTLLGGALYAGIVRLADPAGWAELAGRAGAVVPARFRRGGEGRSSTP